MSKESLLARIPSNLRMTTGQRLRLVADIIENESEAWDQDVWVKSDAPDDELVVGKYSWGDDMYLGNVPVAGVATRAANLCGTTMCIAGWGVALARPSDIGGYRDWARAGAKALGLEYELANRIFTSTSNHDKDWLIPLLRNLADTPPRHRTWGYVQEQGWWQGRGGSES